MTNATPTQHHSPGEGLQAFLSRAATDDLFRAEIRRDPAQAFARYGLHVEPGSIPSSITLPGKNEIGQALASPVSPTSPGDDGDSIVRDIWAGFFVA